jgi:hypothetical protein
MMPTSTAFRRRKIHTIRRSYQSKYLIIHRPGIQTKNIDMMGTVIHTIAPKRGIDTPPKSTNIRDERKTRRTCRTWNQTERKNTRKINIKTNINLNITRRRKVNIRCVSHVVKIVLVFRK